MQHCFWPGFFSLALLFAAVGCGGDDPAPIEAAPANEEQPETPAPATGLRAEPSVFGISIEGTGQALLGQARIEVVELQPDVKFTLTAVYPGNPNDLLLLRLTLPGVESVVGPHAFDLGRPYVAPAFAILSVSGASYSSLDGTFQLTLAADGAMDGRFETSFSEDAAADAPVVLQDGATVLHPADAIRMAGSFEGSWSLLCKSPVLGLPGDHSVSDSPYCNALEF